jgi:hypothetical protein
MRWVWRGLVALALLAALVTGVSSLFGYDYVSCGRMLWEGLRPVAESRDERFLGKVGEHVARCLGDARALAYRDTPWVDWSNYWSTGDAQSKSKEWVGLVGYLQHYLKDGLGSSGALLDLEYQRMELVKFNLHDNYTYKTYVEGKDGKSGSVVRQWPQMRLPQSHPDAPKLAVAADGGQRCKGELIRHRTLTGICNDIDNPLMGASGQLFARNVQFEETFPELDGDGAPRRRHAGRISLATPDPQVISRKLFTRQPGPGSDTCNDGKGLPGFAKEAQCPYKPAPFFNVLAAFWIQFMTHDWFSHLEEARNNQSVLMPMGCTSQKVGNVETPLSPADVAKLGCRPADRMERALIAEYEPPQTFESGGKTYLSRARKTTRNTTTAWWDASQIYGYDERSLRRVRRDPADPAKLLLRPLLARTGAGDRQGYLPAFERCADPALCAINPEWTGQEVAAFPDNWTIGMSFYHNLFSREHNVFVDAFRRKAAASPEEDSGLRNPDRPRQVILYRDVSNEELFQVARLVVSAEIAKIHTIEWTPQLLYGEPLAVGMNSNWNGLFSKSPLMEEALARVVERLGRSDDPKKRTSLYSVFTSGPGIVGTGSTKKGWSLANLDDVNGGVNHFGSPFNFPEEFVSVYRLHSLVPDLLEYRSLVSPDAIQSKVPVIATFRAKATQEMRGRGLADWALSLGRQRLGLLLLQNAPRFLQSLEMRDRLAATETKTLDVIALDIMRDRERGVPRFNEFRRQYGLKTLTGFDDFIDQRLARNKDRLTPGEREALADQEKLARLLREVYGTHRCDDSLVITQSQVFVDDNTKRPITDCLGKPNGSTVDNIEDLDLFVGWHAETTRPHGFAISETQFQVFILNASRRLYSDRFFTSSYRPEFYSTFGLEWVDNNGPDGVVMEKGKPNGRSQPVSPLKRVLLRTIPELAPELDGVVNAFDPWARDRGSYFTLEWKPRPGAERDEAFAGR